MLRPATALLYLIASLSATAASAQEPAPPTDPPREEWDSVTDAIRGHEWADQINNLLAIVRVMPEAKYAFKPTEPMMSFGELIDHIADVQFYFCDGIAKRTGPERPDAQTGASKEVVLGRLMEAVTACDVVFDGLSDEQLVANSASVADGITTMMGHTRRETGKLVTYLRLVDVTPPEIKFYQGRVWRNER